MNILVLDDLPDRHELYDKQYAGEHIHHVYTVLEFFKLIISFPGKFDIMQLDHDLGDPVVAGDGRMAAKLLTLLPEESRPQKIVVHSWNMVCGEEMVRILCEGGYTNVSFEPADDNL